MTDSLIDPSDSEFQAELKRIMETAETFEKGASVKLSLANRLIENLKSVKKQLKNESRFPIIKLSH